MSYDTPELTDEQTLTMTRALLEDHLSLEADGYHCQRQHLIDALVGACASGETIEAVCQDLEAFPCGETLRHYLRTGLRAEQLARLEREVNEALVAHLPERLRHRPQEIAADFHDRPYYGKAPQEEALWVRGPAKAGTTRFFRIATAYVIHRGLRLTLAVHFVRPQETTTEVLQALLERTRLLAISISTLFLDKGFSGIEVLRYLTAAECPAIIACPIRGRRTPTASATRALCQGRRSYRTSYTFSSSAGSFTAPLAVCRVFTTARRTGRMQRRGAWLIFIVLGETLRPLSPRAVRRRYRRRFGIETSYRVAAQVRAWTSSPNPALRFLLMGLSLVLVNVWVRLCWLFTQVPRRGGRRLDVGRFRLHRFKRFITRALERTYGCPHAIRAPAAPIP